MLLDLILGWLITNFDVHNPWFYLSLADISDRLDTRGKWPLARNPHLHKDLFAAAHGSMYSSLLDLIPG